MSVLGFSGAANWVRRVGAHSFPRREQIRFWGAEPQGAWGRFSELRGSRRNDFNVGGGLCGNNVGTAFPTSQSGVKTLDLPQAWKLPAAPVAFAKPDSPFRAASSRLTGLTVDWVGFHFVCCILFTILRGSFLFQALCFPDSIVEWVKLFELWFGGF